MRLETSFEQFFEEISPELLVIKFVGMTPAATPGVRDKLGLNTPRGQAVGMTPGFQGEGDMEDDVDTREALKAGFANLPAPKNDFEIVLEEDLPDGHHDAELDGERAEGYVPDMGDEEEKYRQELEARKQYELSKRHAPLKKK